MTGSRSQVPPQRAALELCTKLGSQTSDPWRGVYVGAGPECRWFVEVVLKLFHNKHRRHRFVPYCLLRLNLTSRGTYCVRVRSKMLTETPGSILAECTYVYKSNAYVHRIALWWVYVVLCTHSRAPFLYKESP